MSLFDVQIAAGAAPAKDAKPVSRASKGTRRRRRPKRRKAIVPATAPAAVSRPEEQATTQPRPAKVEWSPRQLQELAGIAVKLKETENLRYYMTAFRRVCEKYIFKGKEISPRSLETLARRNDLIRRKS